jgi:hypothetical protein
MYPLFNPDNLPPTSCHHFSCPTDHLPQSKHPLVQYHILPETCPMAAFSTAEEAALYQLAMGDDNPEPHMIRSDLSNSYQLPLQPVPRPSNASVEHWLTSESPVARATNFEPPQPPQNQYRLPSLPGSTLLPEILDHSDDVKYDIAAMECIGMPDVSFEQSAHHLHLSEIDNNTQNTSASGTWNLHEEYYASSSPSTPIHSGHDFVPGQCAFPPNSSYGSPDYFDDSPMYSPCSSAPDLYRPMNSPRRGGPYSGRYAAPLPIRIPRSCVMEEGGQEEDEEPQGGKPYAQLIQECLLQAPGHCMMLRDIYEWFERNTTKPRESGGNGWQNSIRHNLSMNRVGTTACRAIFANDAARHLRTTRQP